MALLYKERGFSDIAVSGGCLGTSLYKERRFSGIVVLEEGVYGHRCIRRGGLVTSLY